MLEMFCKSNIYLYLKLSHASTQTIAVVLQYCMYVFETIIDETDSKLALERCKEKNYTPPLLFYFTV